MSDLQQHGTDQEHGTDLRQQHAAATPASPPETALFSTGRDATPPPRRTWLLFAAVAAVVIVSIVAMLFMRSHHDAAPAAQNVALPADPYAPSLPLSELAMSQSTSLSGGTSTFIDGHVRNLGQSTVTGATVQVTFRNEVALPPDIETLPLSLIRTHQPYVDTEPISAAPLKPGDEVEFRLIIENMSANWNQQMPEIQVVRVSKK